MDGIMSSKLFATRQGTIILGVIAAVIAAIALIVYLNQYRNSVNNSALVSVVVAKQTIQPGTPGDVISSNSLYKISKIAKSDPLYTPDALVDPATLNGQVAIRTIYSGKPMTTADFGPGTNSVIQELSATQRAVVIPLGTPQQVGGQIGAGSHVDIWVTVSAGADSHPVVEQLMQDMYVLGASGGNVTLRATPAQAGQLIYASENAQIWFVLRPTVAKNKNTPPVTGLKRG